MNIRLLITPLLVLFALTGSARLASQTCYRFVDEATGLAGFKDGEGHVIAKPQFDTILCPDRFEHIAIVSKQANGPFLFCYLTSRGKIIETFNPYFFDGGADVSYNGFIRFKDKDTDHTGMLNQYGEVAIPAKYNYLSQAHNGFIEALAGAEKVREDDEHWHWAGGEGLLLDTLGSVHIQNFDRIDPYAIDYYSVRISPAPNPDTTRVNYLGANGAYYSFANHLTEFGKWIHAELLIDFTPERFRTALYPYIQINFDYGEPLTVSSDSLMNLYYDLFYQTLIRMNGKDCEFFYDLESYYPDNTPYKERENPDRYPIVEIVITSAKQIQEQVCFLRTGHGYKLISATFRDSAYGESD